MEETKIETTPSVEPTVVAEETIANTTAGNQEKHDEGEDTGTSLIPSPIQPIISPYGGMVDPAELNVCDSCQ